MEVYVRVNDTKGPTAYATQACQVVVSDAEANRTVRLRALVLSPDAIRRIMDKARRNDRINPSYCPRWLYSEELYADDLRGLFRRRGHKTHVIDEEDSCGDDTAKYFRIYVARPNEEIIVTDEGWRVFQSKAKMEDWEGSAAANADAEERVA